MLKRDTKKSTKAEATSQSLRNMNERKKQKEVFEKETNGQIKREKLHQCHTGILLINAERTYCENEIVESQAQNVVRRENKIAFTTALLPTGKLI